MSKHRDSFANSNAQYEDRNKEPEQVLWISVLALAMNDAFKSNDWTAAVEAINWIKHDSTDFKRVCSMAGRSPQYVRNRILEALLDREEMIVGTRSRIRDNVNTAIERKMEEYNGQRN